VTGTIGGATRVAGIIGDPVTHSRSPAIHNAAYAALGLDWVYVAFAVARGRATAALSGLRELGVAGVNVTMPHKEDAARACDELSATARSLGAANTVVVRDGRLVGDSTDGAGFVAALRADGHDPVGRTCAIVGTGATARALAHALGGSGAKVVVAGRRREPAEAAAALAPGGTSTLLGDAGGVLGAADVVVNATPLGMRGESPPFDPEVLHGGQLVVDAVYDPVETPLLAAARARGACAVNGLGMLVHQAAIAFALLTGREAPLDVMLAAARGED
jgi:shikimate dehydrogenase